MVKLSKRLQAVADLVTGGNCICDVGTDHAYIPIYLVQNHRIPKALAMDVNKGPLLRAMEHIAEEQMDNYIVTRQSDGLKQLQSGEADSVIIAGMGGGLVIRILEESFAKLEAVKELILQPQSDIEQVRRFIEAKGFEIIQNDIVFEDGKYYFMFRCIHQVNDVQTESKTIYDRYGKHLILQNHPVLAAFLDKEEAQLLTIKDSLQKQVDSEAAAERQRELQEHLQGIWEAREEMKASCTVEK
jgi:tRNA (adenine22-N1)-methyltransferase